MVKTKRRRRKRGWARRLSSGAQNALEVIRLGRLTQRESTSYDVVHHEQMYKLRRYKSSESGAGESRPPLLLVPPLMLTAEIYDVSPELSATATLVQAGIDTWVVDFGAPERVEGGVERTLDDHIKAVSDAVERVYAASGRSVHVAGYSQGGMFCYQSAAYRRSEHVASVITFGSPVDIHANLPNVSADAAQRLIEVARTFAELPLRHIEGLPGILTSTGFKLLTPVKEAQQLVDFVRKLHDRQALEKRESRRRFLGGEGFVAWPGPALRKFIDEFIVHNRMAHGGFIVDGRTVTLADITCPILYFVGTRDEIARPRSVKAVRRVVPHADCFEVQMPAGHFGLVVGSKAMSITWPTVVDWLQYQSGSGSLPAAVTREQTTAPDDYDDEEVGGFELDVDVELFYDTLSDAASSVWNWLGNATTDIGDAVDSLRYQLPRLSKLRNLEADTSISFALALAQQAERIGEQTFFLWRGRAFSYADADERVDNVVRGLLHVGVRKGQRVGVLMDARPSFLSAVTAINRLGAVSVLFPPDADDAAVREFAEAGGIEFLLCDPAHVQSAVRAYSGDVLVLGGGNERPELPSSAVDMEAIDVAGVVLPKWYRPNPGTASDLAMILFSEGRYERPKPSRITNRRWAFAAYGAAAASTLSPKDTVYCCLPLHHAAGILVSVGAALVGGSRVALAPGFQVVRFWEDVRRYGATVVFYAGEMCRQLVNAPLAASEHNNPLRLFAGSGMRPDVWRRLVDRFGPVGVLEFYATNEGNAVLANASGAKVGALGHPLPGSTELALAEFDFETDDFVRDEHGFYVRASEDSIGVLLARVDATHPSLGGSQTGTRARRIRRDVFATGDVWFVTGDAMRQDADGDFWFVDRLPDLVRSPDGPISTRKIEDAMYHVAGVRLAAAYGARPTGGEAQVPVVSVTLAPDAHLDPDDLAASLRARLAVFELPREVRIVDAIAMTDGYRPLKGRLRDGDATLRALRWNPERSHYEWC